MINIWWNGQIDPNSVNIGATMDLFIVAVIGGISHLEGAWLGAFVFVVANNYMRSLPLVDRIGITEARFNTVVGVVVLIIVVASPNGLMGLITGAANRLRMAASEVAPTQPCPQQPWRNPHEHTRPRDGGPWSPRSPS